MDPKHEAIALLVDRATLLRHAGAILDILRDDRNPRRASDAAQHAITSLDRLLAASSSGTPALACAKGCSICCHNWVSATAPEIFLLARAARADAAAPARIRTAAMASDGMTRAVRVAGAAACALLQQDLCSVYAARPLVCRAFVSTSLDACRAAFSGGPDRIPMPGNFVGLRVAHNHALWAALRATGLPDASYELNAAIARIIEDEEAEARWLAGEDVFADIAIDDAEDAAGAEFTRTLAAELSGG
jgi:Fe-S-cluster containining protein